MRFLFDLQIVKLRNRKDLMVRSEYVASTDPDTCIQCGDCVETCLFGARVLVDEQMKYDSTAWLDLVPGYFTDVLVLRHPGYNVLASNFAARKRNRDLDGMPTALGRPVRFLHFNRIRRDAWQHHLKKAEGSAEAQSAWGEQR